MYKTVSIVGYGWLGNFLAEYFASHGYAVKASTTTPPKLDSMRRKGYGAHLLDLERGIDSSNGLLESEIHFFCIPPSKIKGDYTSSVNAYVSKLKQDQKIIFISSTSVYPASSSVFTEESAIIDNKISQAEKIIAHYQHYLIFRCAGLFGPGRDPGNFLSGKTNLDGPLSTVNLIHAADICEMAFVLVEKKATGIFNLGIHAPFPKQLFYEKACEQAGTIAPLFNKNSASVDRKIDSEKIKLITNLDFLHTQAFYNSLNLKG